MIVRKNLLVPGVIFTMLCALLVMAVLFPLDATNYYVDSSKSAPGSGADTANAWTSLATALDTTLIAGDTIMVRATHDETLGANAGFTSGGAVTNPIVVWGDDGTVWPSSPTGYPMIHCGEYSLTMSSDDYWHFQHVQFDSITYRGFNCAYSDGLLLTQCKFTRPYAAVDIGFYIRLFGRIRIVDCMFDGNDTGTNQGIGIFSNDGMIIIEGGSFDGWDTAIQGVDGTNIYVYQTDFGQIDVNTIDIKADDPGSCAVLILGGNLNDNSSFDLEVGNMTIQSIVARYYIDTNKRPMMYIESEAYSMVSDYGVVHNGGADYSLKVVAPIATNFGIMCPSKLIEYAVHADSAESRDYTLSLWRDVNWPAPTAAELYIEVTYQDADTLKRSASTATLDADSTWYDLTVSSVEPNHDGPVHVALWLLDADADGYIYVDPRLTATGETYHETIYWGGPDLAFLYMAPTAIHSLFRE